MDISLAIKCLQAAASSLKNDIEKLITLEKACDDGAVGIQSTFTAFPVVATRDPTSILDDVFVLPR